MDEQIAWDGLAQIEKQEIYIAAIRVVGGKVSMKDALRIRSANWKDLTATEQELLYRVDWAACIAAAHSPIPVR